MLAALLATRASAGSQPTQAMAVASLTATPSSFSGADPVPVSQPLTIAPFQTATAFPYFTLLQATPQADVTPPDAPPFNLLVQAFLAPPFPYVSRAQSISADAPSGSPGGFRGLLPILRSPGSDVRGSDPPAGSPIVPMQATAWVPSRTTGAARGDEVSPSFVVSQIVRALLAPPAPSRSAPSSDLIVTCAPSPPTLVSFPFGAFQVSVDEADVAPQPAPPAGALVRAYFAPVFPFWSSPSQLAPLLDVPIPPPQPPFPEQPSAPAAPPPPVTTGQPGAGSGAFRGALVETVYYPERTLAEIEDEIMAALGRGPAIRDAPRLEEPRPEHQASPSSPSPSPVVEVPTPGMIQAIVDPSNRGRIMTGLDIALGGAMAIGGQAMGSKKTRNSGLISLAGSLLDILRKAKKKPPA